MKIIFPDGYVARINSGQGYNVLSTKDIGFRNCITPGCTKTFRRHLNSPCVGGEKEHHSNQCSTWHMNMKRRQA